MEIRKRQEGQTLIETAFVLFLLLLILLGITEFSRAWYTKNSMKNAARSGARVAVVTPTGNFPADCDFSSNPSGWTQCPNANVIINAVCSQPGVVAANTRVCVDQIDDNGTSGFQSGDTVRVSANYNNPNFFVVGNSPWPWPKGLNMTTDASMRYE